MSFSPARSAQFTTAMRVLIGLRHGFEQLMANGLRAVEFQRKPEAERQAVESDYTAAFANFEFYRLATEDRLKALADATRRVGVEPDAILADLRVSLGRDEPRIPDDAEAAKIRAELTRLEAAVSKGERDGR